MAGYVTTGTVKSVKLNYDHKLSYQKHNNDVFLKSYLMTDKIGIRP